MLAGRSACESAAPTVFPAKCGLIVGFKGGKSGFEQLAARDNDQVEADRAGRPFVPPKKVSYEPFGPVPLDCAAEFLRRDDAQTGMWSLIRPHNNGHELAIRATAIGKNRLERERASEPL